MNLSTSVPFDEAARRIDARTPLGSNLRTSEWAAVPAAIRERAFFSAGVEDQRILSEMKQRIADDLNLNPDVRFNGKSGFVADMRRKLGAAPGDSGRLTDITSRRRLELIHRMNTEEAFEYGRHKRSQDEDLRKAFPARELIRTESREEPRTWRKRWTANGGTLYGGRMIALLNDPVWTAISRFDRPYPPFDFGSGMGIATVGREEAERLGVIEPGETPEAAEVPDYNATARAGTKGFEDEALSALREIMGAALVAEVGGLRINPVNTGELARKALAGETFKSTAYERVSPSQAAAIAEVADGADLSRYRHSVDSSAIRHVDKTHGDAAGEAARGQIAITQEDFEKLPEITRRISEVRDQGIDPANNLQRIASVSKMEDGTFYMIEEVRSPKGGHLSLVTLMKFKGRAPRANPEMRRANVRNVPGNE